MSILKNIRKAQSQGKGSTIIVDRLDAYFGAGVFPPVIPVEIHTQKESDTAFHPSSDTDPCVRTQFAKMAGDIKREKPSAALNRIFHIGHLLHGWLQSTLVDMDLCGEEHIEVEHRINSAREVLDCSLDWRTDPKVLEADWWARGYADVTSLKVPGKGDYVLDIKTVRGMAFRDENPFGNFREKYERQMQLYCSWHQKDAAILLAISKDTPHGLKEIIVQHDPKMVEDIYQRWDVVADALRRDIPPKCSCENHTVCPVKGLYG